MPGPAPSANRQPRPGRDLPWIDLPKAGRKGRPPAVPAHVQIRKAGRAWWNMAWKTPESTQWGESDRLSAARRAELEDMWQETGDPKLLTEIRHLDTALGLTAKAKKELRWRIVDDAATGGQTAPPEKKKRSRGNLRVVDAQAAG